eukprot:scaffold62448_cov36-Tisochrysis_lutea.AAC.2
MELALARLSIDVGRRLLLLPSINVEAQPARVATPRPEASTCRWRDGEGPRAVHEPKYGPAPPKHKTFCYYVLAQVSIGGPRVFACDGSDLHFLWLSCSALHATSIPTSGHVHGVRNARFLVAAIQEEAHHLSLWHKHGGPQPHRSNVGRKEQNPEEGATPPRKGSATKASQLAPLSSVACHVPLGTRSHAQMIW